MASVPSGKPTAEMATLASAALFIGFLCLVAVAAAWCFGGRTGDWIAPALLGSMLICFLLGLVNLLWLGFWVVLLAGLALMVVAARRMVRQRRLGDLFGLVTEPAVVFFVGFSLVMRYLMRGLLFHGWDEFSHWGTALRATFEHQALSIYNPVDLVYRAYPPGLTLIEYLAVSFRGSFVEPDAIWSMQLLIAALAAAMIARVDWRRGWLALIGFAAVMMIPLAFFGLHIHSTISDPPLAALFGYALAVATFADPRRWTTWLQVALGVAGTALAKDMGALLAVIVIAAFWLRLREVRGIEPDVGWRRPLGIVATGLVPALVWRLAVALTGASSPFTSVVQDAPDGYRWTVLMNFRYAMGAEVMGNNLKFPLTWWEFTALIVLGLWLASRLIRGTGRSVRPTAWLLLGGLLGFTGFLLLSYLYVFQPAEAVTLASYGRYMGTYFAGVAWLGFAALVVWCLAGEGSRLLVRSVATFLALAMGTALISWAPVGRLVNGTTASDSQAMRASYAPALAPLEGLPPDAKIWLVVELSGGFEYWVLRHELGAHRFNPPYTWNLRPSAEVNPPHSPYLRSPEQWAAEITEQDYDYVYVFKTSDEFVATYASLFGGPPTPLTVYRVNRDSTGPCCRRPAERPRQPIRGGGNSGMIPAGRCSNCRNDSAMAASNCTSTSGESQSAGVRTTSMSGSTPWFSMSYQSPPAKMSP